MKKSTMIAITLAILLLVSGSTFAEVVQGTVKSVDLDGKTLEVTKRDAAKGTEETVKIKVSDTTAYTGDATALDEVIEGDTVKIEADKDASGAWVAKSAEVTFAEEEA